jgi:hypothetical protein
LTGDQTPVDAAEGVLAFRRGDHLVAVNFTDQERPVSRGELVVSSDPDRTEASASLNPSEALILRIV